LNLACSDLFEDNRKYTADSVALPDAPRISTAGESMKRARIMLVIK